MSNQPPPRVPEYVIRAATLADVEGFKQLRHDAGAGFTSLMIDDDGMVKKLKQSEQSFATAVTEPGDQRYFLTLEHIASGQLAGCAQVKATVGTDQPFFNFRIIHSAQSSKALSPTVRFDMDVLISVNDFTGFTEVGSLMVLAPHRAHRIGRALAQTRYMLMAADPNRFHKQVVSELRGVVHEDGTSPFWEAVGRHFFKMSFAEADRISATTDNQFILDLMPQHPIYVDLLPEAAQKVIGKCHTDGENARRFLEEEGFFFSDVIDIFDGGPLMSAARDSLRTLRESKRVKLSSGMPPNPKRALVAAPAVKGFRCVQTTTEVIGGEALVDDAVLTALHMKAGDEALVWADAH